MSSSVIITPCPVCKVPMDVYEAYYKCDECGVEARRLDCVVLQCIKKPEFIGLRLENIHYNNKEEKEGIKHDKGKPMFGLIPAICIFQIVKVLTVGSAKYKDRNWEKGVSFQRYFDALNRHIWAWWGGEELDKEDGLHHLAHAACCVIFLLKYALLYDRYKEFDDRRD